MDKRDQITATGMRFHALVGALALGGVENVRVAVRDPHVVLGGPPAYAAVVVARAVGSHPPGGHA